MSPEELAAVRDAYDAFGRGDLDALRRLLHPEIEWRTTPEVPFLGTYRGLDEFLRGMNDWTDAFDDLTTTIEDFVDAGDHVLVHHRMHGRGRDSGAEVDLAIWQLVSVRDGKLVRMHDYLTREEAEAAGGILGS